MYYAPLDELILLQGDELTPEEVEERNQDVSNRPRASARVRSRRTRWVDYCNAL